MSLETASRIGNLIGDIEQADIVNHHLEARNADPNFVMIEIGHDAVPVAYQQPVPFTNSRAYIGVEAWLRNPYGNKPGFVQALHDENNGLAQNIFYINHPPHVAVVHDEDNYSYLVGLYHKYTETILPTGIASEVFVSNVFCDPHIAYSRESTKALLAETARLVATDSRVVLRETITPNSVMHITDELFEECGLKAVAKITYETAGDLWDQLEAVYKGEPSTMPPRPDSYFYILEKTQA